jgi:Baseplate J-like protein
LEPGRWIIVSGNRTDVPNVSGVTASELAMVAAVNQGAQTPLCAAFPADFAPPFLDVSYTTDANALGDRLVVGTLKDGALDKIRGLHPPYVINQKYCDQVQLADGVYVNAYIPTADERDGKFPDFLGMLVDPATHLPFPDGTILLDAIAPAKPQIFAWRISSEPVHTILRLASPLANTYDARTVAVSANVVQATHGQTVGEVLGDGDASQPFQTFALSQLPLTYLPAATPDGAQSTLTVRVNEIEWHAADNLAALGPAGRNYITQTSDADQTSVIFGNGEHGARPPTGNTNIKAVYRYGIGRAGNVKARQISQLATHPQGLQGVINLLPATGGADRDSADQARRNIPIAVKALDRLVSVEDYADFARTYAGIGKASAARLSDGRRQLVQVTIAGADDIPIDINSGLYRNLVKALHRYGDPYGAVQVCVRKVRLLVIVAGVKILADYEWEVVESQVRAALLDGFSFDRRELGQSAFLSEAISLMQGVEGVAYVDVQAFDSVPEDIPTGKLAGLAATLAGPDQPKPYVRAQLARPGDPAANEPRQRILPAELVFLTPDIPGTLIRTEING